MTTAIAQGVVAVLEMRWVQLYPSSADGRQEARSART